MAIKRYRNREIEKINNSEIPTWIKILKCPFCNKKPTLFKIKNQGSRIESTYPNYPFVYPYIRCFNCNTTSANSRTIPDTIMRWNMKVENNEIKKEA